MKKLSLFLAFNLLLLTTFQVKAQKDERTISTRIADVLAQMPAKNEADFATAMKEMEGLGEPGLMQLAQRIVPGGKADNSKLEYAIMGYTSYVSKKGKESLKESAESAWCKSLSTLKDKNNVSFFMSMLEMIGTDKSIDCLVPFLLDDSLNMKTSVTLASIGTPNAGKALTDALSSASVHKNLFLQALGNMHYSAGVKEISSFATSADKKEKQAALYALSEIADPSSALTLLNETGKSFENKYATALYGNYISNLHANGDNILAADLAATFYKNSEKSNVFAKTAALNLMVEIQKEGALKQLVKAVTDKDIEYRNEALRIASPLLNNENSKLFLTTLKKASPEVQADIIRFLGMNQNESSFETILKYAATAKNESVKKAAIIAVAQIGGQKVTSQLLDILKNGTEDNSVAVKQALLLVKESGLPGMIIARIPEFSGIKKATLLDVLGAKHSKESFSVVAAEIANSDAQVKKSALQALPNVATLASLSQLFNMMEANPDETESVVIQKAIMNALDENETTAEKESLVLNKMKESPQKKHSLYFPLLSAIGTQNGLRLIEEAFKNSTGNDKQNALAALTSWSNSNAMEVLYSIASKDTEVQQKNAALLSYIGLIKKAEVSPDQKLLFLKNAMAAAQTAEQKNRILSETAGITIFPALAFAAEYLDNEATKHKAADAVMNIGLSDKAFHGAMVKEWLTKAKNALGGADAIYAQKSIQKFLDDMPDKEGYVSLFNGKDLTGWKGLVGNPVTRSKMSEKELAEAQKKADGELKNNWTIDNGQLLFTGKGNNLATQKKYGDIELQLDWKIFDDGHKEGDGGVYLRGTPQVQIWDTSRTHVGAQVGSGGLYNNLDNESKPLQVADNKLGEWNHFYIKMIGDKVTVYLNGVLVTDNVTMENYWDRKMPLFPVEQLELQAHNSRVAYRDIYIKEIPRTESFVLPEDEKKEGFKVLFDGSTMDEWIGNTTDYVIEDDMMVVHPKPGSRGNLFTKDEYSNFIFRFEFKLTSGANNGLGIRAPLEGDAAYTGMEIQILDNDADVYKDLEEWQYHGSVYGVFPAKRGFLKPLGEWNYQEVVVNGSKIKVILNGTVILDRDLTDAQRRGTIDKTPHPGIFRHKGHLAFLGHGSVVYFRNIRVKEL